MCNLFRHPCVIYVQSSPERRTEGGIAESATFQVFFSDDALPTGNALTSLGEDELSSLFFFISGGLDEAVPPHAGYIGLDPGRNTGIWIPGAFIDMAMGIGGIATDIGPPTVW